MKVLRETLDDPSKLEIPISIIKRAIENDPLLRILQQKIVESQEQMAELKNTTKEDHPKIEDHPKLVSLQQQIKVIEEKIEKNKENNTEEVKKKLQIEYVRQLEQRFFEIQIAVRTQENLIENLQKQYETQIAEIGSRTLQMVEVSFPKP